MGHRLLLEAPGVSVWSRIHYARTGYVRLRGLEVASIGLWGLVGLWDLMGLLWSLVGLLWSLVGLLWCLVGLCDLVGLWGLL